MLLVFGRLPKLNLYVDCLKFILHTTTSSSFPYYRTFLDVQQQWALRGATFRRQVEEEQFDGLSALDLRLQVSENWLDAEPIVLYV